ncbi:MAG: hypothetical protein JF599_03480 [Verrucomicrobia bacterium]|nr:hypothetical protein [Verrucomicrobiota bacterium]
MKTNCSPLRISWPEPTGLALLPPIPPDRPAPQGPAWNDFLVINPRPDLLEAELPTRFFRTYPIDIP